MSRSEASSQTALEAFSASGRGSSQQKSAHAGTVPFLVDVQADLLSELTSRVVIPLTKAPKLAKKPIDRLTPLVEIDGDQYILLTPQIAGIRSKELGPLVANLTKQRHAIVAAINLDPTKTFRARTA